MYIFLSNTVLFVAISSKMHLYLMCACIPIKVSLKKTFNVIIARQSFLTTVFLISCFTKQIT